MPFLTKMKNDRFVSLGSISLVVLFSSFQRQTLCEAFSMTASGNRISPMKSHGRLQPDYHEITRRKTSTSLSFLSKETYSTNTEGVTYDIATSLLNLVLDGMKTDLRAGKSNEEDIESVVRMLTTTAYMTHMYDPDECLSTGNLFCTVHAFTPNEPKAQPPLWEKISMMKTNLKGQQFYESVLRGELDPDMVSHCGNVINYSEIFGKQVHMKAYGKFVPRDKLESLSDHDMQRKGAVAPVAASFLASILRTSIGGSSDKNSATAMKAKQQQRQLRVCPDDYAVDITGASVNILGKSIKVNISGSAFFRVLYADPRLRIFVSLTPSSSVAGDWEQSGLVVVQVRSDLITQDNTPIDLR